MVTAEIKDVRIDDVRGSIIVETEYRINGQVVQTGVTRYMETSGTEAEIIQKAKDDVKTHCENLIRRIATNEAYLKETMLTTQKALTQPIADSIKLSLVGHTDSATSVDTEFKGKVITTTYNGLNSVKDSTKPYEPLTVEPTIG